MKVTNTGVQPLVIGGVMLAPNVEAELPEWAELKKNKIVKFLLDNGTLSLDGPDEEVAELPPVDPKKVESDKKDQMIALLKELGIQADKRSSVESLESQLIKAQQEASKDEPVAL